MLDGLPTVAGVSIQVVPVQFAEASEGGDDLLQLAKLETKEDVLKLGAVEVQADATTYGGHDGRA